MKINIVDFFFNMENVTFGMCGLDKERNILSAPLCECGCGTKMNIWLETEEDIYNYCDTAVSNNEYDDCICFALSCEGSIYCAIRDGEDIYHGYTDTIEDFKHNIGGLANGLCLRHYGLIAEIEPGIWKIVEE